MKAKTPTTQSGKKVLRMNKEGKYLVIAHGPTDGVAKAKEIIKGTESCGINRPPWGEGGKARRYEMLVLHRIQYIRSEDTTSAIL
jgi:hypothetical protein